jgi:hypothetical protein
MVCSTCTAIFGTSPWPSRRGRDAGSEPSRVTPRADCYPVRSPGRSQQRSLDGSHRKLFISCGKWCCQTGLNCRPLHYQWSALPLSYGSMPGIRGIGPSRPPLGGRFLPQGPLWRKHAGGLGTAQNRQKSAQAANEPVKGANLGQSVPISPQPPNRALAFGRRTGYPRFRDAQTIPQRAIAAAIGETHYLPANAVTMRGRRRPILFRPRYTRRDDDG